METSRDDFGIVIRSAFLRRDNQQKFSLFALLILSLVLLFVDTLETKPLNHFRSLVKDVIYRGSVMVSFPSKGFNIVASTVENHINVFMGILKRALIHIQLNVLN